MRTYKTPQDMIADAGEQIGVSNWRTITQDDLNAFADATNDHQWIHVDVERARREMPDGKTIAHGYYVLSLGPTMMDEVFRVEHISRGLNYGSDKIRFMSPAQTGSRIRLRVAFGEIQQRDDGGVRVVIRLAMEAEGVEKPVFVQDMIGLYFP